MSNQPGISAGVRQAAGLSLKSQIEANFAKITMQTIYYVQDKLKIAFMDALAVVRKTVANVMAIIIVRGGFNIWPDLLRFLVEKLQQAG